MWWWRTRRDPRIRDEMRYHRDRLIDDYVAAGLDRAEAERRAFMEFGNVAALEESVRDVRGRWIDDLGKDLVYAVRTLRRSPAFSLVAVLSLALGIGANVAIFSVINGVMLQSLPVKEPDRLVQITRESNDLNGRPAQISYPVFEIFRDRITSISGAFAQPSNQLQQLIAIDGREESVGADLVSGLYFTVLGLEPAAGRLLVPDDDVRSPASPAAVISDRYWQRRFGRNPSAIGTSITVGPRVFTIVGVTPQSFRGIRAGSPPDLMLPLTPMLTDLQRTQAGANFLRLIARLKPGATIEQARAEAQVLYRPVAQAQAAEEPSSRARARLMQQRILAIPARDGFNPVRDNIGTPLLLLMGTVALILLLACVNVSGLLLARAAARQREISIRLAIGAGRGRLVRQFLTESLVLAAVGGAAGFAIAGRVGEKLFSLFVNGRVVDIPVRPDARVVVFTAVVSLVACAAAGLVPAMQGFGAHINPALKQVPAQAHGRLGMMLVVAQLALSMILVVGATLFIGTLVKLYAVDRGFDIDGLVVLQTRSLRPLPADASNAMQRLLLERLTAMPGVNSASAAAMLPVGGGLWTRNVRVEGHPSQAGEPESVAFNAIAPRYFATMGTPLREGREFTDRDAASSPFVAIVNESFARSFFGGASPIGRHVTSVGVGYEIVGVVADAKYQELRESTFPTMYIPWTQRNDTQTYGFVVRVAGGDPLRLSPSIVRTLREVAPALGVAALSRYESWIDSTIPTERLMATVGAAIGALALMLAGVGVFGVLAFQVERRTNELGVRTVLGASRWSMMRLVLRDVLMMLVPGVAIGAAAALMLTGLTRSLLFGLSPTDPAVFAGSALILAAAALIAGWVPARRASSVDPLVALRHE